MNSVMDSGAYPAPSEKPWLGVHFPRLGLEVFTRRAKALAECPVVLLENNRVVQRNQQAARLNIGISSTLATAHAVAPEVKHFNRDFDEEYKRLTYLAEIAYGFSGEVSLHPPDSLVLEINRSLKLFGGASVLIDTLSQHYQALNHQVVMQTGATPLASLALTHTEYRLNKPAADLSCVPLVCTNLSNTLIERLTNMGLHKLGQLLALPKKELGQRFGKDMVDYLSRLKGDKPDPQKNLIPKPRYKNCIHLLESARDKSALLFPMQRLTSELSQWLTSNQLGTSQLTWGFFPFAKKHGEKLTVSLATPHQNKSKLYEVSQLKFTSASLPEDVVSVQIQASQLSPWTNTSQALFKHLSPPSKQELSELIDRLHARLGANICSGISLANDHRPEFAWQQSKLLAAQTINKSDHLEDGTSRPLWLFPQPEPAHHSQLELLQGPERIQSGWWDKAVKRDYYIARHTSGALCWVFVHHNKKASNPLRWYIHGYFS